MVDRDGTRMAQSQSCEERDLAGLRDLELEGAEAVDHVRTDLVEVREEVERLENRLRVAARPSRRAHPIENDRVGTLALGWIEDERIARVEPLVREAPAIELSEERLEPEWVLVDDSDRLSHEF